MFGARRLGPGGREARCLRKPASITGDEKEGYLTNEPAGDARFIAVFVHSLEHTGGDSPRKQDGWHGRSLIKDVFDAFITLITNRKVTKDGVGPHGYLIAKFPYVGAPHRAA